MFSMQFREVVCSLCFLCVVMFSLCFDVSGISMSEFERARDSHFVIVGCWRKHVFDIVWHFLLLIRRQWWLRRGLRSMAMQWAFFNLNNCGGL